MVCRIVGYTMNIDGAVLERIAVRTTPPQKTSVMERTEPMKPMKNRPYATDRSRWEAVLRREREADGVFLYGVLTTLVYCRPVCASRRPNYENVRFFDTWEQAEQAGFRPCKRCCPRSNAKTDGPEEKIVMACRRMDEAEEHIPLKKLAAESGLSPYHFHRLFKKTTGVTPKQYAVRKRLNRVRSQLKKRSSVTDAVYDAGFASGSRFYENAADNLGMKPSDYRKGAEGVRIRVATAKSWLGWVLIGATDLGVCAVDIGDNPEMLRARLIEDFPKADIRDGGDDLKQWVDRILKHLENPSERPNLPLDIRGAAFQHRVWQAIREIPTGSKAGYKEIAEKIGNPKASRAVARACASNKIAVVVPCHRVVRKNGELGGYRWGVERKRALLDREVK